MNKAKWYNPTGNPEWDEYYRVAGIIFGPLLLLFLVIVGAAIYNTFVRHIN